MATSKTFNEKDVQAKIVRLKQRFKHVLPIGKTCEVLRGLYKSCNGAQFFVSNGNDSPLCPPKDKAFFSLISKGFLDKEGVLYTEIWTCKPDASFTAHREDGMISIQDNYMLSTVSGFYDVEMAREGHFEVVVAFISSIDGNDDDVVAINMLITYAATRSASCRKSFSEAILKVKDTKPYKDLMHLIQLMPLYEEVSKPEKENI